MYRSSVGHVSVEYRWIKTISVDTFIGRLSADISATYSTHDPSIVGGTHESQKVTNVYCLLSQRTTRQLKI